MIKVKGIIFDMDNTLLRSSIDFAAMKQDVAAFISTYGIRLSESELLRHTTSTIIEEAVQAKLLSDEAIAQLWDVVQGHEVQGMHHADLEPGAKQLLEQLKPNYKLIVITNNAYAAAAKALQANQIMHYFDNVLGRESANALKPSPVAFYNVLELYADTTPEDWLSIGDSWIDGKASLAAGIPFIAYQSDKAKMMEMGVEPLAFISALEELHDYLI
ncbi:HAD family hydrolase [Paenibacillus septentrionalis]|uniref:HAD family hydrolase n=1 Tax=Paenibacillus septentrionalis TaxID=429342 RepID=A0ABW1V3J5_9BACL